MFYVDIEGSPEIDPSVKCAIGHLREISPFVRIFSSFPCGGNLLEDTVSILEGRKQLTPRDTSANGGVCTIQAYGSPQDVDVLGRSRDGGSNTPGMDRSSSKTQERESKSRVIAKNHLQIGISGFGNFGQFLAKKFIAVGHRVNAYSRSNYEEVCAELGCKWCNSLDELCKISDVIIVATSILAFEKSIQSLAIPLSKDPSLCPLIVDVCSVKQHPRTTMVKNLPEDVDILCTHPMFGPESARHGWTNLVMMFEHVRIRQSESTHKKHSV